MVSKKEFKREVWKIVSEINATPRQIRISSMKAKIGSRSKRNTVTFDPSALSYDDNKRREVIIHELLHTRYKNHGKMFKAVLSAYVHSKNKQ